MGKPPMKCYLLPEDLKNALLTYLMGRPYMETARGIQQLEGLPVLPDEVAEKAFNRTAQAQDSGEKGQTPSATHKNPKSWGKPG